MRLIRPVRLSDAEAIAEIYNGYILNGTESFEEVPLSTEAMSRRIAGIAEEYPYLVCEAEGKIAGYCYAHRWKERTAYRYTAEIALYLAPEHIGQGIGRQLEEQLIEECRKAGLRTLIACITGGNEPSIRLQQKLGFRQVSHFKNVGRKFGQWLDVVDFQLEIGKMPE